MDLKSRCFCEDRRTDTTVLALAREETWSYLLMIYHQLTNAASAKVWGNDLIWRAKPKSL